MDKDCIFCKIVRGEAPSYKIWGDGKHIAFLSISPNTLGFTIVATKKHLPSYAFDNKDRIVSDLVLATKKVAKILDSTFDDVARCGMFFEGFGVDHLHSKLYPMHGTGNKNKWKQWRSGSEMKIFFKKYPGYISSHDSIRAEDKQLKELAGKIIKTANKMKC